MDDPTPSGPGARSALALALATAAGNILAYVFTIAMSRMLGVRDFGELGTLLGIWLILTGLLPLLRLGIPESGTILAVLAIAAGVLILVGK